MEDTKKYLNEKNLGIFLKKFYNKEFINNKRVPNSNILNRPDFRNDELKLIIEFNGFQHYINPEVIIRDKNKEKCYKNMGYKVINIPYFIQLSKKVIEFLFGEEIEYQQTYPHGFIDEKATLPSCFCELGIKRFLKDLELFNFCFEDIKKSLLEKIEEKGNFDLVIPESIRIIFNLN